MGAARIQTLDPSPRAARMCRLRCHAAKAVLTAAAALVAAGAAQAALAFAAGGALRPGGAAGSRARSAGARREATSTAFGGPPTQEDVQRLVVDPLYRSTPQVGKARGAK